MGEEVGLGVSEEAWYAASYGRVTPRDQGRRNWAGGKDGWSGSDERSGVKGPPEPARVHHTGRSGKDRRV